MINTYIKKLVCYGLEKNFYEERDVIFIINQILDALGLSEFECDEFLAKSCWESLIFLDL